MTGMWVDAQVMADTNEKVKGVLGWPAYVLAGSAMSAPGARPSGRRWRRARAAAGAGRGMRTASTW